MANNTEQTKPITREEALKNLDTWLDMAAHNSTYNKYDELCRQAYDVLTHEEYDRIYKQWANGYVSCSDGLYRRR